MRYFALFAISALGCSSTPIPTPRYGEHPQPLSDWQEVGTPPPPIEVEEIGAASAGYVWLDGQWVYQALTKRWLWEQGRWCIEPPSTLFYAPAQISRERQVQKEEDVSQRVLRWNEVKQRYERIEVQTDHWRWQPGAFYVTGAGGKPTRWQGELSCRLPETEH